MARSITKVMDHAAVGAAGLYSRRQPFADVIENDRNGVLLGDAPEEWIEAIRQLAVDHKRRQALARGGIDLAFRLGNPDITRAFWLDELGISEPK